MTTKYAKDIASAQADIAADGVVVTWTRKTDDDSNSTPYYTAVGPSQSWQVSLVFLTSSRQNLYTRRMNSQDQTATTILAIMAGGQEFEPALGDVVTMPDGSQVTLTDFNVVRPDGVPVLYNLDFAA